GFIRTADGEPVPEAVVTLLSRGGRQLDRVTSLADGSYIVAVPGPGTYLLAVTAATHHSRAGHVAVGEGPLVHDVELAEGEVDAVS
ncbi:carboxypeptidase-like regulatory domain-containing protein, partial [Streptomyces sp. NPDC086077]|uniref:carboxypeptidase-like regulatory domain-containing protein n=1 Tax=Streptomyces sp. NPDC086077 TaxID=3154862 RepID=UPI0034462917